MAGPLGGSLQRQDLQLFQLLVSGKRKRTCSGSTFPTMDQLWAVFISDAPPMPHTWNTLTSPPESTNPWRVGLLHKGKRALECGNAVICSKRAMSRSECVRSVVVTDR